MQARKKNQLVEKSRKKVYALYLTEDNIKNFENKIGYNSKSNIVDILISNFVNNKKSLPLTTRQTRTIKTFKDRNERL